MCHNDDGLRTRIITCYALNIESFGQITYRRRGASVCMIFMMKLVILLLPVSQSGKTLPCVLYL